MKWGPAVCVLEVLHVIWMLSKGGEPLANQITWTLWAPGDAQGPCVGLQGAAPWSVWSGAVLRRPSPPWSPHGAMGIGRWHLSNMSLYPVLGAGKYPRCDLLFHPLCNLVNQSFADTILLLRKFGLRTVNSVKSGCFPEPMLHQPPQPLWHMCPLPPEHLGRHLHKATASLAGAHSVFPSLPHPTRLLASC